MRIARIGLTGGIAEGKSTVLGYLRDAGWSTASADEAAREVFVRSDIQAELADALGLRLPINREAMRKVLAASPLARRRINAVMHGPVTAVLSQSGADVVEVPLLVETCLMSAFDEVWVVTCGADEQLRRITARLGSEEDAKKMMATQLPTRVKIAFADEVIRTDRTTIDVQNFTRLLVSARTAV